MKTKYLMIVSLMLLILTIGAACAAEDADALAVDEGGDNQLAESFAANDSLMGASDDEFPLGDDGGYDVAVDVWNDPDLDDSRDYFADVYAPRDAFGNVTVEVDGIICFDKDISRCRYYDENGDEISYIIGPTDLNTSFDSGLYSIKVSYLGGNYQPCSDSDLIEFYASVGDYDDSGDKVVVVAYDQIYLDHNGDWEDYLARIEAPASATGNVTVLINGVKAFEREVATMYIRPSDLNVSLEYGATYDVEVRYAGDGTFEEAEESVKMNTTYQLDAGLSNSRLKYGSNQVLYVTLPENADGNLTVDIDGNAYPVNCTGRQVVFNLSDADPALGNHVIGVSYKNDSIYPDKYCTFNFTVVPNVLGYSVVSSDEEPLIMVIAPKGSSGSVTAELNGGNSITSSMVDGTAVIKLPKLSEYTFIVVNMTIDGQKYVDTMRMYVVGNAEGFTSSVSSTEIDVGDNVTVTVTGQDIISDASISVDYVSHDVNSTTNTFTENITGLAVGQHVIHVSVYGSNYINYNNGFLITVRDPNATEANTTPGNNSNQENINGSGTGGNAQTSDADAQAATVSAADTIKLTLKKVTVKKSAKKLVLQATLKINGKAVKGKVIKFKFKGKTYKAKTNKKGIAKVTVKKAVLKKLKVGKKVKYQASYGGKTVKKTVKVKK